MTDGFDPIAYLNEPRWHQVKPGLKRIRELLERLENPQHGMQVIHVAGTNGKGSVCAFTASMLHYAGYRVGLFTSPYLMEFAERIRIDNVNIKADELLAVTLLVREQAEQMREHPTEFELMTAVALVAFARAQVDIVVLEVGLGGLLDSTNIIDAPKVCAIAPIALDHTRLLGDTIAQIASEKAGIIKRGSTVVSAVQEPDAAAIIRVQAEATACTLRIVDKHALVLSEKIERFEGGSFQTFSYREFTGLRTRLLGIYQPENAALAIEIVLALRERGFALSDEAIYQGIAATIWPGRFEVVAHNPLFIVDGGHNPQGAHVLAQTLRHFVADKKIVFIFGVLADKDYPAMLAEVYDLAENFVLVKPPNPRALPLSRLCTTLLSVASQQGGCPACLRPYLAESYSDAIRAARRAAGTDGVVCAFGSLYSIGPIMKALAKDNS